MRSRASFLQCVPTHAVCYLKILMWLRILHTHVQDIPSTTHVAVVDVSGGCGAKFEAVIVSTSFEGKPLLARHRSAHS